MSLEIGFKLRGWPLTYNEALLHLTGGTLPCDFSDWGLKDERGTPLAHFAAMHGLLPAGFEHWDLSNEFGVTTLRVLLGVGADVPDGFEDWARLVDGERTVIEVARALGNRRLVAKFEAWKLAHEIAKDTSSLPSRPLITRDAV